MPYKKLNLKTGDELNEAVFKQIDNNFENIYNSLLDIINALSERVTELENNSGGGTPEPKPDEPTLQKLDTPIIEVVDDGVVTNTSAILGEAMLGYAVSGDTGSRINKLDTPVIRLEIVEEPLVKLATPNIYLYEEEIVQPYKQELEYLESDGTQYIDTGLLAPLNTDIEVTFKLNATEQISSNNGAVFGGRDSTNSNTCAFFYLASTNPQYFRFDRTGQVQLGTADEITIDKNSIYKFSYKSNEISIKNLTTNEEVSKSIGETSSLTKYNLCLFAANTAGSVGTYLTGRIYEWKYYVNGNLVQHFIPVLDWDNVPCMYDKVSNKLFYNNGTGDFSYGVKEDKSKLETPTIELAEVIFKLDTPVIDIVEV